VSNRNRITASLDDTKNYRTEMEFRYKARDYVYSERLHLMVLSAYTQASVQNADQTIVLVAKDNTKRKLSLTMLELQTLLDRCDRTLFRMERARTKVDEVTA